jgi:protein gp37
MTELNTVVPSLSGGEYTKISWADLTFNGWWGCVKVSPACRFCYADPWANRWGHDVWGKKKPRRLFGPKHWNEPRVWDRRALRIGRPLTVFCGSMKDVFEDHPQLDTERAKLWPLIEETPNLRWMLTTKRPENAASMVPEHWMRDGWPGHVWLCVSAETQRFADQRLPISMELPVTGVRFASCEPLLERLDLSRYLGPGRLDWVIAGGGSGEDHRRTEVEWLRDLRDQCNNAGALFHLKQLGQELAKDFAASGKGDAPDCWPADLRRQDMPTLGDLVGGRNA